MKNNKTDSISVMDYRQYRRAGRLVLAQDKKSEKVLFHRLSVKKCVVCGALFISGAIRANYYSECVTRMDRINATKRKRKCHALGVKTLINQGFFGGGRY